VEIPTATALYYRLPCLVNVRADDIGSILPPRQGMSYCDPFLQTLVLLLSPVPGHGTDLGYHSSQIDGFRQLFSITDERLAHPYTLKERVPVSLSIPTFHSGHAWPPSPMHAFQAMPKKARHDCTAD
jgi:hypothetical protein